MDSASRPYHRTLTARQCGSNNQEEADLGISGSEPPTSAPISELPSTKACRQSSEVAILPGARETESLTLVSY